MAKNYLLAWIIWVGLVRWLKMANHQHLTGYCGDHDGLAIGTCTNNQFTGVVQMKSGNTLVTKTIIKNAEVKIRTVSPKEIIETYFDDGKISRVEHHLMTRKIVFDRWVRNSTATP